MHRAVPGDSRLHSRHHGAAKASREPSRQRERTRLDRNRDGWDLYRGLGDRLGLIHHRRHRLLTALSDRLQLCHFSADCPAILDLVC